MKSKWESSRSIIAVLQAARAEGIDITADCYPYDFWLSTLKVLFPNRDYDNLAGAEFADLVLFDPATVRDNATADHPTALSSGIAAVWVNGQLVFENGKTTGKLPGVVVRR